MVYGIDSPEATFKLVNKLRARRAHNVDSNIFDEAKTIWDGVLYDFRALACGPSSIEIPCQCHGTVKLADLIDRQGLAVRAVVPCCDGYTQLLYYDSSVYIARQHARSPLALFRTWYTNHRTPLLAEYDIEDVFKYAYLKATYGGIKALNTDLGKFFILGEANHRQKLTFD
jgi:hypothetical protein